MRSAGKGFAALAVFTLCTLAFAGTHPRHCRGQLFAGEGGAYTPNQATWIISAQGPRRRRDRHYFLPFLSGELGRLLRIQRQWG